MKYYGYQIMIREKEHNHILMCRILFSQYIVDMYAKIESERLLFIRLNQKKLRAENYIHLRDAIINDDKVKEIGKTVILPSTYTGSPRHMHEYAQDAMTYVRKYGKPDLFITFTCNSKWHEIEDLLQNGQVPSDRHDIIARIFKQKLIRMMNAITKSQIYGKVRCWMYAVEWQKRGLPHAHILIWLETKLKPNQVDDIISAELPDHKEDPILFNIIRQHMIHGPCGILNPNSPCMKDNVCTKRYPRDFVRETQTDKEGYPLYRRRGPDDGGLKTTFENQNGQIEVDNRWVVPYSPFLSKTFNAHINIEMCNSVKSIKYICKYIYKGSDMSVFEITNDNQQNDEISQFRLGRYISSNEAVWRILGFNIHERFPPVQHLAVHLENGQRIYYTEENALEKVNNPPNTSLTAFFKLCQTDDFAKTLFYHEVPKYFCWNNPKKIFTRRKQGINSI